MTEKQEIQLRLVCAPEHFPSETTCETPIKSELQSGTSIVY